jgi:hypothetical protein
VADSVPSPRWLIVIVLAGLAILALSLAPGWLLHVRHLGGHGLTHLDTMTGAWEGRSVPVLSAGVVLAVASGAAALLTLARPHRLLGALLLGGSLSAAAVLAGSAWPISQSGHASGVEISARWPLLAAIGLAAIMSVGAVALRGVAAPWRWAAVGVLLVAVAAGAAGGRQLLLNAAEGTGRHWEDGGYTRQATDGQPTETLTITNGTFNVSDRWSGTFEGDGLVVVLTEDPACPDARGAYHLFGVGERDVRWEMIVDTCADGERATDLMAGTWVRDR